MLNRFEKAHAFIDFLERNSYEGEIRVSIEEHTFKMIDGVVPSNTKVITKSRIQSKNTVIQTSKKGDTHVENFQWSKYKNPTKDWNKIIASALIANKFYSVENVRYLTYEELSGLPDIGPRLARIIVEALRRNSQ